MTLTPIGQMKTILDNPNSKIEDILNHEFCYSLSEQNFPPLIQYLALHIKEVLNLAIFSDNHNLQFRAFSIINLHNQTILASIVQTHTLSSIIEDNLTSEKPNEIVIDRLFYVLEVCVEDFFDELKGQLWYLNNSIHLLNHQSILSFYDYALLTKNATNFVEYLITIEFDVSLITEIENISFPGYDPDLACGLYELLWLLLKYNNILSRFTSPSRISSIITPPVGAPLYVIDQYSLMLVALCNDFSISFIISSLDFLFKKTPPLIHQYHISAFKIAAKLFEIPDNSYNLLHVIDFAFDIFFEYTHHSFALLGASDLIEHVMKSPEYSKNVINRFLAMASYVLESNNNRLLYPICMNLLGKMSRITLNCSEDDKVSLQRLVQIYVIPFETKCNEEYGGMVKMDNIII